MSLLYEPLSARWLARLHNLCFAAGLTTLICWIGSSLGLLPNNNASVAILTLLFVGSGLGVVASRRELRRRGLVRNGDNG